MEWENKDNSYMCVFGSKRALISLIPLLICVGYFVGFELYFSPIFLSFTILILSTTLFTLSYKPFKHVPNTIHDQNIPLQTFEETQHDHENKPNQEHKQAQDYHENKANQEQNQAQDHENNSNQEDKQAQEEEKDMMSLSSSRDSLSSESEWLNFSDDGSISDEESLIEIALPSGHVEFDDHKTDLLAFKQRNLMELLAEINEIIIEEDNLIEIDISIGSIKCSRFEIQA